MITYEQRLDLLTEKLQSMNRELEAIVDTLEEPDELSQRVREADARRESIARNTNDSNVIQLFDRQDARTQLAIAAASTAAEIDHKTLKGDTRMINNSPTPVDHQAARELAAHWLRRVTDTEAFGVPDFVDSAALVGVSDAILAAKNAGASPECIFCAGVAMGFEIASLVIDDPLGRGDLQARLREAIAVADKELRDLVA